VKQWELRGVTVDRDAEPGADFHDLAPSPGVSDSSIRSLFDQLPGLFWTTDADLRFTCSLGAGLAEVGLGSNQVVGTSVRDLFEGRGLDVTPVDAHRRALAGESVQFEMWWAGRAFSCQAAPLRDLDGEPLGVICVAVDVTRPGGSVEPFLSLSHPAVMP
jgi:PAS domain-containing protein